MTLKFGHSGNYSPDPVVENVYESKLFLYWPDGKHVHIKIHVWDKDGERYIKGWETDGMGCGNEQFR